MTTVAELERAGDGVAPIEVRDLTMRYQAHVVMRDLSFQVGRGEVFVVMGGSGSGKSTLLKHLIGLKEPAQGSILFEGEDFGAADAEARKRVLRRMGVLYQNGALWGGMTLAENVALPLEEFTELDAAGVAEVVALKLALVGLRGFEDYMPSQISGGMQKRAALARAIALDPEVLFFDEPSSGLDPLTARRLDDLMLELRDGLGTTLVVVSHDLASILAIGDDSILLDAEAKTAIASGSPRDLLAHSRDPRVRSFLTRGAEGEAPHNVEAGARSGTA
jgi:phospholipid/cholesterol/gamma-HCH transport system ATP-binding protein